MSQEKIQALISLLKLTLENVKPKVADEMVKMAITALEEEKGKMV
jgi:flagellar biosynthesis/type III secretory pathway protein FliH